LRAGEGERGEGTQVGEGFECARQTATRKGMEDKPTFFLWSSYLGFLIRIRFLCFFVLV
jgi:hypothetical protein